MPATDLPITFYGKLYFGLVGGLAIICFIADFVGDLRKVSHTRQLPLPPWKIGWVDFMLFIVYTLLGVIFITSLVALTQRIFPAIAAAETWLTIINSAGSHLTIILAAYLCVRYFPLAFNLKSETPAEKRRHPVVAALIFFFAALPLVGGVNLAWTGALTWLASLGLADPPTQQATVTLVAGITDPWGYCGMAITAVILAPISEELLFRGCLYRFLKGKLNPLLAVTIAAFLFALLHAHTTTFLPLFCLGLLLCRCYEKSGELSVCIGFHALFNLNTFIALQFMNP